MISPSFSDKSGIDPMELLQADWLRKGSSAFRNGDLIALGQDGLRRLYLAGELSTEQFESCVGDYLRLRPIEAQR